MRINAQHLGQPAVSRLVQVGFALLILFISATVLVLYQTASQLAGSERWVSHTHEVLTTLEQLQSTLKDAEAGQRSYLTTHDVGYLVPYQTGRSNALLALQQLTAQSAGNSDEGARIPDIRQQVTGKLGGLQHEIDLQHGSAGGALPDLLIHDPRIEPPDRVQVTVTEVEQAELQLLRQRRATTDQNIGRMRLAFVMGTALTLALLGGLYLLITRDLLRRKQALAVRDQFLIAAGHELKTPLSSLRGFTQLLRGRLQRNYTLQDRDRQSLEILDDQVERLARLTTMLLDVSSLQTGKLGLSPDEVDLKHVVQDALTRLEAVLAQHTLRVELCDEPLIVAGDKLRLDQINDNLLQNAVKYSPLGGEITVTLARRGDQAVLSVADQGIGIPPDALPHLFKQFYRGHNVGQHSIAGFGVGLYLVKELLTLHGGSITVQSKLGSGTCFLATLPLIDRSPGRAHHRSSFSPRGSIWRTQHPG